MNKINYLLVVFCLFFVINIGQTIDVEMGRSSPVIPQNITADKAKIVVDISHGYEAFIPAKASVMGGLLEGTGDFEVVTPEMKTPINDSILVDADVFVIMFPDPSMPYSNEEIKVVKDFLQGGGSVLFVSNPQVWKVNPSEPGLDNSELNNIIEELGFPLQFSETLIQVKTDISGSEIPDHPIMDYMDSFYMVASPLTIENTNNFEILTQGSKSGVMYDDFAIFENNSFRSAFVGSYGPFLEYMAYDPKESEEAVDHYQFQYNLMAWLSYRSPKELTSDIFPIRVYSGFDSPHDINEIKEMPYYQGIFHFHTGTGDGTITEPFAGMSQTLVELGHDFVIPTDYNTVSGGPSLRKDLQSKGIDIVVIDGEEATGIGQYHVTGAFKPNNATTVEGVSDPIERIALFHEQDSLAFLAHPSWLISPTYPRIWDHDLYPFDGYEAVNSGFLQGCGNLAKYPFYGATDSHSSEMADMATVWNYVFTNDEITEDPQWWFDAILDRRVVAYSHLGDYYFGDKLLVDEIIGRLTDEQEPEITIVSPTAIVPNEQTQLTVVVNDASRITSVSLKITVNGEDQETVDLTHDANNYSLYTHDLGSFKENDTVTITITAVDNLGYEGIKTVTFEVNEPSDTSSSNGMITDKASMWPLMATLVGIIVPIILRTKNKRKAS